MKRKVIKQGHNTLTITLPSKWVERNGINQGDELDLAEDDHILTINTKGNYSKERSAVFNTEKLGHFKNNYINCLYHAGFDVIDVKFHKPEIMREINKRIRDYCPGFEVVSQGKETCQIKAVSNVLEEDFDQLVRRIFLMLISLLEEVCEVLETHDYSRLTNIRELEGLNNRYTSYCKRILNKIGYHEHEKTIFYYALMYDLEKLADDYKHMADFLSRNPSHKPSKKTAGYSKEILKQFRTYYELFYKFDKEKAKYIFTETKNILDDGISLLEETNTKDKIVLHFLLNTVIKTYELTEPYIEMNLFSKGSI